MPSLRPFNFEIDEFQSEQVMRSLRALARCLTFGGASDMRTGGGAAASVRGGERYYIYATIEEEALAWCARRFADRAHMPGKLIDAKSAMGSLKTKQDVSRAEAAMKDAIMHGDGDSLIACGQAAERFGRSASSRLRALSWAAQVLGQRCRMGDFAGAAALPPTSAPTSTPGTPRGNDSSWTAPRVAPNMRRGPPAALPPGLPPQSPAAAGAPSLGDVDEYETRVSADEAAVLSKWFTSVPREPTATETHYLNGRAMRG